MPLFILACLTLARNLAKRFSCSFFDVSDGMLKRFRKDELPLYLPIIRTNIPNIDAKALCNFLRREGYCDRRN